MRDSIEVKESTGKGLGVFAITDIPCGARVLAEEPLLRVDEGNGSAKDILSAFQKLSVSQQHLYLQLHGFAGAAFKRSAEKEIGRAWPASPLRERDILAIWAANGFGHVFLLGSRFNHSCIPNIHFAYNPTLDKETFHAVRNIAAGEELTITYIDGMNRTRGQRKVELDERGFVCDCPACENTKDGQRKVGPESVGIVYSGTPPGSLLRRLIVDNIASIAYNDTEEGVGWMTFIDGYPREALVDALKATLKMRHKVETARRPKLTSFKLYFEEEQ